MRIRFFSLFGMALSAATLAGDLHSLETSSLTIRECLESARRNNKDLVKGRQRLTEVNYERWDLKSRFLPSVSLEGRRYWPGLDQLEQQTTVDQSQIRIQQRVLEFGADAREDVSFRAERRQALYDYESRTRQILSSVRRNFYLALLKEQQVQSRREVLRAVSDKLRGIRIRYARGVAKEFELLTARLDSLEQEGQIQGLLGERAELKLSLARLIGRPTESELLLSGRVEPFPLSLEAAVATAIREDLQVRRLGEEVEELGRERREAGLGYLPDFRFQVGVQDERGTTSLDLRKSAQSRTWLVDAASSLWVSRPGPAVQSFPFPSRTRSRFASFQIAVPFLSAFRNHGMFGAAGARLSQGQTSLVDRKVQVEREVRGYHQTLKDRTVQMEIDGERLNIARRRLEIQERLRDMGRATDYEVETFRNAFFQEQERYFRTQDAYIAALEDLRLAVGAFD